MTRPALVLLSDSAATDGGYVAIADMATCLGDGKYRLLGGTAVMLHVHRLNIDIPVRATGDADFGVPPYVLQDEGLVQRIEALGYTKVKGNRWERQIDEIRSASVDLLIPSYTSRPRSSVQIGTTNTTEVPGLAFAFQRPPVVVTARLVLTSGESFDTTIQIPDAVSMLGLKLGVRTVRNEDRDADDLWRCIEVLYADPSRDEARTLPKFAAMYPQLEGELGLDGRSLDVICRHVTPDEAARRRTRILALVRAMKPTATAT